MEKLHHFKEGYFRMGAKQQCKRKKASGVVSYVHCGSLFNVRCLYKASVQKLEMINLWANAIGNDKFVQICSVVGAKGVPMYKCTS